MGLGKRQPGQAGEFRELTRLPGQAGEFREPVRLPGQARRLSEPMRLAGQAGEFRRPVSSGVSTHQSKRSTHRPSRFSGHTQPQNSRTIFSLKYFIFLDSLS